MNARHPWLADRTEHFASSGIRRVFDLAAKLKDPINLSIGQPDFDVPDAIRDAAADAIQAGKNGYSPTQGIAPLRERLAEQIRERHPDQDRDVFVCSGTSGGLVLAMLATVDPGDEVIFADPYFVMYPALVAMCGGVPVPVDVGPDGRWDPADVEAAVTSRTKAIVVNSPSNPSGQVMSPEDAARIADVARRHDVLLISDEIYSRFVYDGPFDSMANHHDRCLVVDGFSKSHAMTGWRVGWVHGPKEVVSAMLKIQQYSFVCSPQPAQWGGLAAMDVDLSAHIDDYRRKRDRIVDGIGDVYDVAAPGGAFYAFPRLPAGIGGDEFVKRAVDRNLLVIPGHIFSRHDTHFRLSFAASDETLDRGIDVLRELADG